MTTQARNDRGPWVITPFVIEAEEGVLDDLRDRLRRTRWPEPAPAAGWAQGVPLDYLRDLCGYWADGYDWRATEARLNQLPQFRTEVDGLYWESFTEVQARFRTGTTDTVTVPTGCSIFPKENPRPSRRWAQRRFTTIHYWNEPDRGGHFAAFEQPALFMNEVRACFHPLRAPGTPTSDTIHSASDGATRSGGAQDDLGRGTEGSRVVS